MRQYNIDIFNLSNTTHNYKFEVNSAFFEHFENSLIDKGNVIIDVTLRKSDTFIEMQFQINGEIELICDRSLEKYTEKIENTNSMLFKFEDRWEELSDEIVTIPRDEQKLNVGQYIYEFICLDVPMKKIHPKFRDQENEGVIYSSMEEDTTKINDPRWDKLKGLIK
ncbi:MAG: DUF177 domain-containing protein [Cyclobacteriaceae bacterium]|nr:DUF177 domain-containing protein [Cyclobacteriaceae bacterium]